MYRAYVIGTSLCLIMIIIYLLVHSRSTTNIDKSFRSSYLFTMYIHIHADKKKCCRLDYYNYSLYNVPRSKTDRLQIQNQCARILQNRRAGNILPQFLKN